MSTERIRQLHERASELYLRGDYQGALAAWREVLVLDPADQQAVAGIRMASQLVDQGATASQPLLASSGAEIEQEVDRGLRILDGVGISESLDFGDDGSVDRMPGPEVEPEPEPSLIPEGWKAETESLPDEPAFDLESVDLASAGDGPTDTPPPSPAASAAAAELKRRVEDLLREAKLKADAGERDDALAILSRLSILDEDNAAAEALRASLERASASDHDKVEHAIIEGVSAFESGLLDEAERFFREALERSPSHKEAQHYMEKIAERRTSAVEDLLADSGGEAAPNDGAVQHATGTTTPVAIAKPAPPAKATRSAAAVIEPALAPPAVRRPRFALPSPKVLIATGVGAVVLVGAASVALGLFRSSDKTQTPVAPVAHRPKPKKPTAAGPSAVAGATLTPEERAKAVATSLESGNSRMAANDFGGAIVAFHEVLTLEPNNDAAKAGITQAGERYKASKAERDALDAIKVAYRDGEFTSGLRLAYRLPSTVRASYIEAIKVTGWYNLSVVDLRAGDCKAAMTHLDEAIQIAPSDADIKKLKEFATRCDGETKDRSYLDTVEALSFRPTPSS